MMLLSPVMTETVEQNEKMAAGGIVIDTNAEGEQKVLIVHRPEYDDWSFPKGGLDQGESLEDCALREVREETGVECRITREVATSRYDYRTRKGNLRPKVVHYFLMEPVERSIQVDGQEVDIAEWLTMDEAKERLSYERDKEILNNLATDR